MHSYGVGMRYSNERRLQRPRAHALFLSFSSKTSFGVCPHRGITDHVIFRFATFHAYLRHRLSETSSTLTSTSENIPTTLQHPIHLFRNTQISNSSIIHTLYTHNASSHLHRPPRRLNPHLPLHPPTHLSPPHPTPQQHHHSLLPRKSPRPLLLPAQCRLHVQNRHLRRYGPRRRARLRRRHETADQSQPGHRHHRGCEIQDVWLRERDCE